MKFKIDNREYETYQLSNTDLVELLRGQTLTEEERTELNKALLERFEYNLCPKKNEGETKNDVFVRFFSNYVNGGMESVREYNYETGENEWIGGAKAAARKMARDHRYLQNEMFKVCLEYIKILAENHKNGKYDARNQYACQASEYMIDGLITNDYPY